MLHTRSLVLAGCLLYLSGCGARTDADDYRVDVPVTTDVPIAPDVPVAPDVPIVTDVPIPPPDLPAMCPGALTRCGAVCSDLRFDNNNCGGCGVSCGPMGTCSGGTCASVACVDGFTFCNGECVDTNNSSAHCGACNVLCPTGLTCQGGRCTATLCSPGLTLCGSTCVDTLVNVTNCGACGRACPSGSSCQMGACTPAVIMTGTPFRIDALTSSNCRATEHNTATGDDRGGIAVGSGRVYYTGDDRTAAFDLDSLAPLAQGAQRLDGIVGASALNLALTLGSNRAPLDERTSIIDTLLAVGPDANVSARLIALSNTIFIDRMTMSNGVGIFGGVDRVIVTEGARAWIIDGLMARVTQLAIAPIGEHQACESWAFWGVAEFFEGAPWVAYVRDARTVVRQNLVTGEVRVVASFDNLSDMCSFTVLPSRNRWYFHHEGGSQFRTGDETLGYCDARFRTTP